ncbi:MAG: hypothetical protein J6T30_02885 [Bacteroidales bacterium]|nr:hypothetical protein [Bacteroidales bacterium]
MNNLNNYQNNVTMRKLGMNEMAEINGGEIDCSNENMKKVSIIGFVTGVLSFIPYGALIFGPTAIAMSAYATYCEFN